MHSYGQHTSVPLLTFPVIGMFACAGSKNVPSQCDHKDCPGTYEQQSGIEVVWSCILASQFRQVKQYIWAINGLCVLCILYHCVHNCKCSMLSCSTLCWLPVSFWAHLEYFIGWYFKLCTLMNFMIYFLDTGVFIVMLLLHLCIAGCSCFYSRHELLAGTGGDVYR